MWNDIITELQQSVSSYCTVAAQTVSKSHVATQHAKIANNIEQVQSYLKKIQALLCPSQQARLVS